MSSFDLLIGDVKVYDGSGAPPRRADVAIKNGHIVAVGDHKGASADLKIEGQGRALAPGFIDVHTHDDRALLIGDMAPKASQGVTSVVVGNCGVSLAPIAFDKAPPPPLDLLGDAKDYAFPTFARYMAALEKGTTLNAAVLCGHMTLRAATMSDFERPANAGEVAKMRALLEEALAAGAIGFSTGLDYEPSKKSSTEEVIEIARPLKAAGAIYTTHMRDEGEDILEAMDEAFRIGREVGVPVVISHFKVSGQENWGRSKETIAKFDAARKTQKLSLDAYPYIASSTVLRPQYVTEARRVLVTWSKAVPAMAGRFLKEIAEEWGISQMEAAERLQPAGAVYFAMDEEDVSRILAFPETMIGSDGLPHDSHPHPRLWGAFPRVLGHYARDEKLFPLEEAIRRMTSLPAERFGLKGRGRIQPGYAADLVLFDQDKVIDAATFAEPKQPAKGIDLVLVNGQAVWQSGQTTGAKPGKVLKRA